MVSSAPDPDHCRGLCARGEFMAAEVVHPDKELPCLLCAMTRAKKGWAALDSHQAVVHAHQAQHLIPNAPQTMLHHSQALLYCGVDEVIPIFASSPEQHGGWGLWVCVHAFAAHLGLVRGAGAVEPEQATLAALAPLGSGTGDAVHACLLAA